MNLEDGLVARSNHLGTIEDIDDTIVHHQAALKLLSPDQTDNNAVFFALGISFLYRYKKLGLIKDLQESILNFRKSVALCAPGHPQRTLSLRNLALALQDSYKQQGDIDAIQEAITLHREALSGHPSGHPNRPASLNHLANALRTLYRQQGATKDLEESISHTRESLGLCPIGHPDRSQSLHSLASALQSRYELNGSMEDLEESITAHREALSLRLPGHPERQKSLNNLAVVVMHHYDQISTAEDLEEAISLHRESLVLLPPGHPDRSVPLNNLANTLKIRYVGYGEVKDLEEAISCHREALALCPPGHPSRPKSLNNLATVIQLRSVQQDGSIDMDGLKEVIFLHRQALNLRPNGHPDRPGSLNNLAYVLRTAYEQQGNLEHLEEAIVLHREALDHFTSGHPRRSLALQSMACVLASRHKELHQEQDLEEAFQLYQEASEDPTSFLQNRVTASVTWMKQAFYFRHNTLLSACKSTMHLLNRSLIVHGDIERQQQFLATAKVPKYLASDAAAAVIDTGKLEEAVELLEQGRALLWSKVASYKDPLEELRRVEGTIGLADRLGSINSQLEGILLKPEGSTLEGDVMVSSAPGLDSQVRKHRILQEEWEATVEEIRQIEGFENFLRAPPFKMLQTAAAEGPVILVNISKYRCDAIILFSNRTPTLVPLSYIRREDLIEQASKLSFPREIIRTVRELWSTIVSPVVQRLKEMGVREGERIWWCPTSELCALPLHAAGPYRPGEKNLPDIYISSYTPTLSALIKARSNLNQKLNIPKLLVVGQPGHHLTRVHDEVNIIRQHGEHVNVLMESKATRNSVLALLKQYSWVHFACHGRLGSKEHPFRASFELHGKPLTLLSLMRAKLPNAELAFLSACHSAAGDTRTPDESIHLSAALQFCGFRSVVGTMWEMNDEDGPTIAQAFYKDMFRDGTMANFKDSAKALNSAIRTMRKNGIPLDRWIMFIHIGA